MTADQQSRNNISQAGVNYVSNTTNTIEEPLETNDEMRKRPESSVEAHVSAKLREKKAKKIGPPKYEDLMQFNTKVNKDLATMNWQMNKLRNA